MTGAEVVFPTMQQFLAFASAVAMLVYAAGQAVATASPMPSPTGEIP